MNLLLRLVLYALCFVFVFPKIDGLAFHGAFWPEGIVFSLLYMLVEFVCGIGFALCLIPLAILTRGLGVILAIFLVIFGFWAINAGVLMLAAHFFPQYLTVASFWPAVLGGLVLSIVYMLTGGINVKVKTKTRNGRD